MSKYTKISILYLCCIAAGLGAAYIDNVPLLAIVEAGFIVSLVVALIFLTHIVREKLYGTKK